MYLHHPNTPWLDFDLLFSFWSSSRSSLFTSLFIPMVKSVTLWTEATKGKNRFIWFLLFFSCLAWRALGRWLFLNATLKWWISGWTFVRLYKHTTDVSCLLFFLTDKMFVLSFYFHSFKHRITGYATWGSCICLGNSPLSLFA